MYYNWQVFGRLFVISYSYYVPPSYVNWTTVANSINIEYIPNGFFGLLFSKSRGVFIISPVTILGIIPVFYFLKKKQWHLLLFQLIPFSGILVMSAYSMWHGGNSVGYRHILIGAVIFAMMSAFFVEKNKGIFLLFSSFLLVWSVATGLGAFFIQLDPNLLEKTWKFEPADIHADFYRELMIPILIKLMRSIIGV